MVISALGLRLIHLILMSGCSTMHGTLETNRNLFASANHLWALGASEHGVAAHCAELLEATERLNTWFIRPAARCTILDLLSASTTRVLYNTACFHNYPACPCIAHVEMVICDY